MTGSETPSFSGVPSLTHIHEFLEAFEEARVHDPEAPLEQYLPPSGHPLRAEVLHEIIRIDLEHGWARGQARPLTEYQTRFPEAFADPDCAAELAFEEYRQRLQAGESPDAAEYADRFGVNTTDWPSTADSSIAARDLQTRRMPALAPRAIASAALAYRSRLRQSSSMLDKLIGSVSGLAACADVFRELHEADPGEAERVAEAVTSLPEVGGRLGDFDLVDELGRGAFGRVFLARQRDLAGRCVALKVSADLLGESQALAQLLHNNVMPIYGCQRFGAFEAIWMPYLGSTTLADVLEELAGRGDLPVSGKGLVSTLRDMGSSKRSTLDSKGEAPVVSPVAQAKPSMARQGTSRFTLDLLEKYSYVNAVLWLGTRLADGLAHAHEHGIQHRDLKPANILLSDEGQPILLDFNLATDTKLHGSPAAARVGGTLPYMSPEQLRAMGGEKPSIDERSDVFSVGVILYELLTGRHPYALLPGRARLILRGLIAERCRPPLPPHRLNRELTPAAEAIVLKCLAAEPAQRYQSARELQEDLERQLANLPLRYAPERSLRERAVKWARRHPRLSSSSSIGICASIVLVVLATILGFSLQRGYQFEASQKGRALVQGAAEAQLLLSSRTEDPGQPRRVLELGEQCLRAFGVPAASELGSSSHYRWLPRGEQERLEREAGKLLFAMSRAAMLEARSTDATERLPCLKEAERLNALATATFATTEPPRALWKQRAEIMEKMGQPDAAKTLQEEFMRRRDLGSLDQVLAAREHVVQGKYRAARPLLLEVTQREPLDYQAWFLLARCYDEFGEDDRAVSSYSTCLALQPLLPRLWFNRGLAYLRQKDFKRAKNDFDRAIELDSANPDAWFNRALAAAGMRDFKAAVADYTRSLELGEPATSVYFMRSRAYEKLGDAAAAKKDFDEGLRRQPTDARSFVARGGALIDTAPEKALADFEQALRLNPRYRKALENKAHVFSECLGRTAEGIQVLTQLLEEYPDEVAARSSRGVLLARLNRRDEALRDAEDALLRTSDGDIQYQVAGIYALASRTHADDARKALSLLFAALRAGFGLDLVDRDPDLDPIRSRPEFAQAVEAARTLHNQPAVGQPRP